MSGRKRAAPAGRAAPAAGNGANGLVGRTALVTGAGRRVGRAIALALAAEGVNVIVHYRTSRREARELSDELVDRGVRSWTLGADLRDARACAELVGRSRRAAGRLDFLVNSAATFETDSLAALDFESVCRSLEINAWAPFVLSREFAAGAQRGAIVNLLDSRIGGYDWSHVAYILSKQALATLTRMTALAFAPRVRVNAVGPGLILPPPGKAEAYLEHLVGTVPLRRHGSPADVAAAVVYLLGAEFVTGVTIDVDGGLHLHGGQPWTGS